MADFCRQCSLRIFGQDFGDLKHLVTEEQANEDKCADVICEGCGPTQVNRRGDCVNHDPDHKDHHRGDQEDGA